MSESLKAASDLFYNPFAEAGHEFFDPITSHDSMWQRYKNQEVEHDYTSDQFLKDTQSLMMDTQFVGQFAQAQMIASRMHELCGEDHALAQSLSSNEAMSGYFRSFDGHDNHDHADSVNARRNNADDTDPITGKKKKKRYSLFGFHLS